MCNLDQGQWCVDGVGIAGLSAGCLLQSCTSIVPEFCTFMGKSVASPPAASELYLVTFVVVVDTFSALI